MAHRRMRLFLSTLYVMLMGWAWLAPFEVLTDTKDVWLFWCFLALFGISRWFALFPWLPFLLTGIGFVGLYYGYYFRAWDLFSSAWLKAWGAELAASFPFLLVRDWLAMSPMARTFYFFLLLWSFCAVVWHYVYRKGRIFWFIFLSAVYFSVLDTFTPYDARGAMMLTFVAGLVFLLWLRLSHLPQKEPSRVRVQWLAGGLALVLLATSVAYAAPKPGPAWPDPISWLVHGGAAGRDDAMVRKVGYGSNDARLGGAFIEDNGVALQVRTTAPAYWRGESKDVYTGKGWLNSVHGRSENRLLAVGEDVPADYPQLFDRSAVDVKPVWQHVQWAAETPPVRGRQRYPLFHQGMVVSVADADVRMFAWGQDARGIFSLNQAVTNAQLQAVLPVVDEAKLRQTGQNYPPDIQLRYLQLPSIPERVRQLAETLTAGAANPYDKVKAVEAYLQSAEFAYDTRNVTVPEEDEDFVDQFLFESKRGYCDYFSTAMVVLLRSVGIPSRWVKGFTAGELVQKKGLVDGEAWATEEQTYYEGTVYNRHAHSWVEVYFAGVGWLPFEPTKGFVLPQAVSEEDGPAETGDDESSVTEEAGDAEETGGDTPSTPESDWPSWFSPLESGGANMGWLAVVTGVLGLFVLCGWFFRDPVWFWWKLNRWRRKDVTPEVFMRAYRRLLAALEQQTARRPAETLREYLRRIRLDHVLAAQTQVYEALRYGDSAAFGEEHRWDEQLRRLYAVYRQVRAARFPFVRRKTVLSRTFNE